MTRAKPIPQQLIRSLRYCEKTGDVFWTSGRRSGKRAGYETTSGYLRIKHRGAEYMLHRVIWVMMKGEPPGGWEPDHRNTCRHDNRWLNLRLAKHACNVANQTLGKRNKSGYKGVSWDAGRGCWTAGISISGKRKALGRFADPAEAHQAYVTAAAEAFGEFARAA